MQPLLLLLLLLSLLAVVVVVVGVWLVLLALMMALAIDAANDACGSLSDGESIDDLDDFVCSLLLSLLVFTLMPLGSRLSIVKFTRGSDLSPVKSNESDVKVILGKYK